MTDPLSASIRIAGAGLAAQSTRMQIAAENLANVNSTGSSPGAQPYSRKTVSFKNELDERLEVETVQVDEVGTDRRSAILEYSPGHPAADANGYVKRPNIDPVVEMADMREANRSYMANVQVVRLAREAIGMTIDLLKSNQ